MTTAGTIRPGERRHRATPPGSLASAAVVVLGLAFAGCSAESFQVADVTGTVTLAGKPVAGVLVQFEPQPVEKRTLPAAYGTTDADGRYRLSRVGGKDGKPGAAVGLNHVRLSVPEGSAAKIHPRYAGDGTFWHEVAAGPNVFDFELRDDPLAPRPRGEQD